MSRLRKNLGGFMLVLQIQSIHTLVITSPLDLLQKNLHDILNFSFTLLDKKAALISFSDTKKKSSSIKF